MWDPQAQPALSQVKEVVFFFFPGCSILPCNEQIPHPCLSAAVTGENETVLKWRFLQIKGKFSI